jgi:hypothetical protein
MPQSIGRGTLVMPVAAFLHCAAHVCLLGVIACQAALAPYEFEVQNIAGMLRPRVWVGIRILNFRLV